MSEDKKQETTEEEVKETVENTEETIVEDTSASSAEPEEKGIDAEVEKDALGLEELPDEIKKKMEKKKSEKSSVKSKRGKAVRKKKKVARKVSVGKAFIKATYNNTIVTLTDLQGNALSWASAGVAGFKGPKKATPYAAQIIARLAVGKAREEYGLTDVSVYVSGIGSGREAAIRSLNNNGLNVTLIKDITPIPHNGCRNKKPRRV